MSSSDKASAEQRLRQLRREKRGGIRLPSTSSIVRRIAVADRKSFEELRQANRTNRANVGGPGFTLTH